MRYRMIKKNGDALSVLGFGCMRLPQKKGNPGDGKIDEERAQKQIHYALENGINYFDTAMPYHLGASESFLGKVFEDGLREKVRLATKLPPFHVKKPDDMGHILTAQLKKLRTDYIDYYLLHSLDRQSWDKLKSFGVLDFLEEEKRRQRILYTGFSYHGDRDTFKEIIDTFDWEICQIQYNFLDEQNQAGRRGLKYAASKDVGVIIMEPLRGGNIARRVPAAVKDIWQQAHQKRTPAEWALRWIWNHHEVSVVLSGMNEEEHIRENIRVADDALPGSLNESDLQLVDRVKKKYKELMKIGCTGCNYCMPCPSGVNIPACFQFYNSAHMFARPRDAKLNYLIFLSGVTGEFSGASLCQKCGECEAVCPQHLQISENLEKVKAQFEGKWMKPTAWFVKKIMAFQKWKDLRGVRRRGAWDSVDQIKKKGAEK